MIKKHIVIPTVALFVICLVATALLAFANSITAPKIEQIAKETEISSRKEVFADADNFEDKTDGKLTYAVALDKDGKETGYVFTTSAKSYGGDILVMTGVDTQGKVTGVKLLSINDTAGLGMKATGEDFRSQFIGLIKNIVVQKNTSNHDNNEITALTGATITSNAVTSAVNEALANYDTVNGGAN